MRIGDNDMSIIPLTALSIMKYGMSIGLWCLAGPAAPQPSAEHQGFQQY
jgi:hypothetical protein